MDWQKVNNRRKQMDFGRAPIKMEGGIADPDAMEWGCDCEKCAARYKKWKQAYKAEQAQFYGESNETTDTTEETQGR